MLEFREYSDFNTFRVIYTEKGYEIGVLDLRNHLWVFVPDNTVAYYSYEHLEQITNKLRELNERMG